MMQSVSVAVDARIIGLSITPGSRVFLRELPAVRRCNLHLLNAQS
jgi:hypothetical protein